ncbi:acyl--CoA ligase [Myxococcota bacterium]|nr:acyl--CoA ligase [Myxococcota bacterium]
MTKDLDLPCDPTHLTLGHFISDMASIHANRIAVVFEGAETTYQELESQSRELARGLIGAGAVKGARIAVFMANRLEWIISAFAVTRIGCVLVPVNTFAPSEERDYILRHSDTSLLLMQPNLLGRSLLGELLDDHPEIARGSSGHLRCNALPQLRRVASLEGDVPSQGVESWNTLLGRGSDVPDSLIANTCDETLPSDDGLIIYTSGTSSRPKGVLHRQRAPVIQSYRLANYMRLGPEDRVFTAQPFFWTAGIAWSLGATLAAGGRVLLQETFRPGDALDLIETQRATVVHAWPHQEKLLAEHETIEERDLSSLEKIEFTSLLAPIAGLSQDNWGAYSSYGTTETFTPAAMLPSDTPAEIRHRTHGRPLPGMQIRVIEPDTGEALGPESSGEITVKGISLMRSYYKVAPEHCFDDLGFFRTQDGGRIDEEGYLHWTGRLSDMIKTGGANVSPLEIEIALTDCPGLRAGLAVGVPHPSLGEVLVLCALPIQEMISDEETIRSYLRERISSYKVPRHILFFEENEIEFTGNQKIQMAPLRKKVLQRLCSERTSIAGYRYGSEDEPIDL